MRVLSLLWGFSLGGIGKYAVTLAKLNEDYDIQLDTVCIQSVNWACDLTPLKAIGATILPIQNRRDFSWIRQCGVLIEAAKTDLIFVHGFNGPVVASILQRKLKRSLPFVCSYHSFYYPPHWSRLAFAPLFNAAMIKLYKSKSKGIVAVSQFGKDSLVGKGIPERKVYVIHNGLVRDSAIQRVLSRAEVGLREKDVVIGVVTRLDPFKGLEYLIEAVYALLSRVPLIHLLVIGEGVFRETLEQQCLRLNLQSRVHFVGCQTDIDAWLRLMDIFVLPSLIENHSVALLEAMRAGKAIVATQAGGNPESIRHEQEGLLVSPADSQALADAMNRMVMDAALRQRLGKAARCRFEEEFTEQNMLTKLATWLKGFV